MSLTGKHVIILGAGRSGRAAAALALREGARVSVHDVSESISGFSTEVEITPSATPATGTASECDLLVVSPGIDTFGEFVKAYSKGAGEVIGEIELACRYYDGRIVAITGTNGKTTTTELVQRILSHNGISCVACGNYGMPLAEVVMTENVPESVALELSSFQLETISTFHADVVIWLNFSADHMDRYPDLKSYKSAKLRIFENATDQDLAVIRAGEDIPNIKSQVRTFSTEAAADYTLDKQVICLDGEPLLDLTNTRLRGLHNAENAMAAVAACSAMGVNAAGATDALKGFAPPMHRCELIRTLDGVEYINDSKATNLHALDSALRSQGRPIVLIAGGKQKGLDYAEVLERLSATTKSIVVFGEIANSLAQTFSPLADSVPCTVVNDLDQAVQVARASATHGDTILFSPGTSSFDMFSGYEERGDCFRRIVNNQK